MRKKIFIRADGSLLIGLGHLYRTLALADMLKDYFQIHYVCKSAPDNFIDLLINKKFEFSSIEDETQWLSLLSIENIVVLDGYGFTISFQETIKRSGSKLVCLNDIPDRFVYADILVNHAPGIHEIAYKGSRIDKFALGTSYALLRPTFISVAKQPARNRTIIKDVFICLGGSDQLNISFKVALELIDYSNYNLHIVLGASNVNMEQYVQFQKVNPSRINLYIGITEEEMVKQMQLADFGIVSSSTTLFECMACKLPVVSGYYVDNQRLIHEGLKMENCFLDAGDYRSGDWKSMLAKVEVKQLNSLLPYQAVMIDGLSPERFLKLFTELAA